jgi:hypothetical protein
MAVKKGKIATPGLKEDEVEIPNATNSPGEDDVEETDDDEDEDGDDEEEEDEE